MTYEQARPIVERRLYAYCDLDTVQPVSATSRWSDMPAGGGTTSSQQERWATSREDTWQDAVLIERLLKVLGRREQYLIELRYRERRTWTDIARRMGLGSTRDAFALRDRALYFIACHMGLLDERNKRTSPGD